MINENREYRNFAFFETRDKAEDPDYKVKGYASTFDEYELFKFNGKSYCERIEPSAFDKADLSDVIFLYNHEGMVYARNKNGTLKLSTDKQGFLAEADLSSTDKSKQMYEQIRSGLVDQMSFAFTVEEDALERSEEKLVRVIKRIRKVYDVSAVSIPANPNTDISAVSARSYFDGVIEKEEAERLLKEERAREIEKIKLRLRLMED